MGKLATQSDTPHKVEVGSAAKSARSKKRVSRACDECRLHKARCDGLKTCGTCFRYDRVCSYNLLPIECQGSAARIRILEHRLVKARECIEELQKQVPRRATTTDMNQALAPQSTSQVALSASIMSHAGQGQFAGLGFSFIESLLQPLLAHDRVKALVRSIRLRSILCDSSDMTDVPNKGFCQLPPYETMLEVLYAAFCNVFALASILPEQPFRIATQRLYDINPISYTQEDTDFVPLFCAVIALGMIHCSSIHQRWGYARVIRESLLYFEAAAATISKDEECRTTPRLQLALCVVLYSLHTSKLDLARPALQIVCASTMVRDMFRNVAARDAGSHSPADMHPKDMVWVILYLDMHISSLLGLASLLNEPGPEMATIYAVNSAAYNVASYKRSHNPFLLSVSIAMAIELIKLTQQMSPDYVTAHKLPTSAASDKQPLPTDLQKWATLENELDTWEHIFHNIFPENDGIAVIASARNELQLHFYLAQIMLHHNSLHLHGESPGLKSPPQIEDIRKGRTCLVAATEVVTYTSTHLEQTNSTTLSWISAYTLFVSTITLLVATSSADRQVKLSLERTVRSAVQILRHTTYGSSYSKTFYLEILHVLCTTLNIAFDPTESILLPQEPGLVHTSPSVRQSSPSMSLNSPSTNQTSPFLYQTSWLGQSGSQDSGTQYSSPVSHKDQQWTPSVESVISEWNFDPR